MRRTAAALISFLCLAAPAGARTSAVHPDDEIWTADRDGSSIRHLTSGKHEHFGPIWSPDGRRVAVFAGQFYPRSGFFDAWAEVRSRSGRLLRAFPRTREEGELIGWSPDSRWLLWTVLHDNGSPYPSRWDPRLYALDTRTGERHLLTRGVHATEELPSVGWSPDSRHVAFVEGRYTNVAKDLPLVTIRPDGTGRRVVTRDAAYFREWSKHGIYYDHPGPRARENPFVSHELRLVDPAGGEPRTVLHAVSYFAGVSPDGDWLLYRRRHPGGIWMARADGSGRRRLAGPRYQFGWAPGNRGAYVVESRLRLFPVSGGERNIGRVNYGPIEWSRDGRWIAWERGERTIAVMDEHGRHRHVAIRVPLGDDVGLYGWMPGSDRLLFGVGVPPD